MTDVPVGSGNGILYNSAGSYETLEAVVRRDRRRLGALLGYVRYALNPALQAEAVRLGHHLSARLPAIVDFLIQPTPGEGCIWQSPCRSC